MKDKDAILYSSFLGGSEEALEQLIVRYSDSLIRFAYLYVKDSFVAEDIAEETFATLFIKRKKFKEQAKFKTYLYQIARNKCIDYLRKTPHLIPLKEAENVLKGDDLEELLPDRELYEKIYRCLSKLPQQYSDVLHLVYIENFSINEVCKITSKTAKQVYNLLSRARSSLKELLIKEGVSHEDL